MKWSTYAESPVILSLIPLYFIGWISIQTETIAREGWTYYLASSNEIFMLPENLKFFMTVLVVAPILEEFFFRGFIMQSLEKKYSKNMALMLSATLFAFGHINFGNNVYSVTLNAFFCGLFFGWIFQRTRNIKVAIFAHFFWNFLSYAFNLTMFHFGPLISSFESMTSLMLTLLMISIFLLFIDYKICKKTFNFKSLL